MIQLAPGTKVYLACRPVSMRYGFDGLAAQVSQVLGADPFLCVGGLWRRDGRAGSRDDAAPPRTAVVSMVVGSGRDWHSHDGGSACWSSISSTRVLRRLRSGAFGEDIDRIAAHFSTRL